MNALTNQVEVKDITTLRPGPCKEFRSGSHCGSEIGWGCHICKKMPGCIKAHSKTLINSIVHVQITQHMFAGKVRGRSGGIGWKREQGEGVGKP